MRIDALRARARKGIDPDRVEEQGGLKSPVTYPPAVQAVWESIQRTVKAFRYQKNTPEMCEALVEALGGVLTSAIESGVMHGVTRRDIAELRVEGERSEVNVIWPDAVIYFFRSQEVKK